MGPWWASAAKRNGADGLAAAGGEQHGIGAAGDGTGHGQQALMGAQGGRPPTAHAWQGSAQPTAPPLPRGGRWKRPPPPTPLHRSLLMASKPAPLPASRKSFFGGIDAALAPPFAVVLALGPQQVGLHRLLGFPINKPASRWCGRPIERNPPERPGYQAQLQSCMGACCRAG